MYAPFEGLVSRLGELEGVVPFPSFREPESIWRELLPSIDNYFVDICIILLVFKRI